MVWSRPIPWGGQPTNGRVITTAEVLPKKQGIQAPIDLPSPGILHQEEESPEHLVLKANGAYLWKTQRAVGNRDHTLKWHT